MFGGIWSFGALVAGKRSCGMGPILKMKSRRIFLFIFLMLFMGSVRADFISLIKADQCETIIEMFIDENQIRITFEIGMNDLEHFKELIPEEYLSDSIREIIRKQHKDFFYRNVFITKADGEKLIGTITNREFKPRQYRASLYTGKIDTNINVSKIVLFTEITYPLNRKPKVISFTPPIREGHKASLANIGFITYHNRIPVNDLRYLGLEATVNLDWEDPWYSKFNNRNLRRHHQSSLMSFLYVDPYEVRHEVLVRIMDLEYWMDLDYELGDYIEIGEQDSLKTRIADFLKKHNVVTIDGKISEPIVDKIHFVKWSLAGIQIQEIKERLDYSSAVIGVIFAYPHDSIAQKITIDWELFSDKITEVPNVATDPAGPMPYTLKTNDHILTWTNYLKKYKLPTISNVVVTSSNIDLIKYGGGLLVFSGLILLILAGLKRKKLSFNAAIILLFGFLIFLSGRFYSYHITLPFFSKTTFSKPEASDLVRQLLKNTYRAFDFREESDVYDKLAVSNDGDLLAEVYLQTKKSMVLENQGGIQVKVKEVEVLDVEEVSSENKGMAYQCKWIVRGDVGHWGHIHRRTNQYSAILNVKPVDGVWKLFDIDIIEETRL